MSYNINLKTQAICLNKTVMKMKSEQDSSHVGVRENRGSNNGTDNGINLRTCVGVETNLELTLGTPH